MSKSKAADKSVRPTRLRAVYRWPTRLCRREPRQSADFCGRAVLGHIGTDANRETGKAVAPGLQFFPARDFVGRVAPGSEENFQAIFGAVLLCGIGQHEQTGFVVLILPRLKKTIGRGQGGSVFGVGRLRRKRYAWSWRRQTVETCKARERTMSGKARCLPDSRRACPERSRRDAGATNSGFTINYAGRREITPITTEVLSAATNGGRASSPVSLPRGRGRPRHIRHYEISLASAKAAAAATPPMAMVCNALRAGPVPV